MVNQILRATLKSLLDISNLSKDHKMKIYLQLHKLQNISNIILIRNHFFLVRINRNNIDYQKMLLLARLIYELKNLSDDEGSFNLVNILNDTWKMQFIFEKFILNFYRYEQNQFLSKVEKLKWKMFGENLALIPEMKTDISLIDKVNKKKIIIEAKYYADIFMKSFNANKIRSGHLYQLFTYLNHSSDIYMSRGILVYPTNGIQVDEIYSVPIQRGLEIKETTIRIYTLDLNQKWANIHNQLFELLQI